MDTTNQEGGHLAESAFMAAAGIKGGLTDGGAV